MQEAPTTLRDIRSSITVTVVPPCVNSGEAADTVTFRSKDFSYTFKWVVTEEGYEGPDTENIDDQNTQVSRAMDEINAHRQSLKHLFKGLCCDAAGIDFPGEVDDRFVVHWDSEMAQLANKVYDDWYQQVDYLWIAVDFAGSAMWRRLSTWRPDHMVYAFGVGNSPDNCCVRD
ncbi:MAG: hypothetical protein LQ346_007113 [Caloplaca aetnensis]|nr:MAG: hypothetical protein LQ346_007113 [Caloplaca aetnensis]